MWKGRATHAKLQLANLYCNTYLKHQPDKATAGAATEAASLILLTVLLCALMSSSYSERVHSLAFSSQMAEGGMANSWTIAQLIAKLRLLSRAMIAGWPAIPVGSSKKLNTTSRRRLLFQGCSRDGVFWEKMLPAHSFLLR